MHKFIRPNSFIKEEPKKPQTAPAVKQQAKKSPDTVDYSKSNYVRMLLKHEHIKNKFNHFF